MRRKARRSLWALIASAALLSSCAGSLSLAPARVYRVGYLSGNAQAETATNVDSLRKALRDLGYVEGRNLTLEVRYTDGHAEREPALAAELLALKPDVIIVRAVPEALVMKHATSTIPIVLAGTRDPVENGLVESLARPGVNITGAAGAGAEVVQRRLQLLKDTVPRASRVAFLFEASNPDQVRTYQQAQSAAAALGIELQPLEVRSPDDFADAFAAARRAQPDAIYAGGGPLISSQRPRVLEFLAASRLPSMTAATRDSVDRGALMYYDADLVEVYTRAAGYVDQIIKGAKPGDLPIEQPTKFELIINMRTAKALGLAIPPSVLAQATELIQ